MIRRLAHPKFEDAFGLRVHETEGPDGASLLTLGELPFGSLENVQFYLRLKDDVSDEAVEQLIAIIKACCNDFVAEFTDPAANDPMMMDDARGLQPDHSDWAGQVPRGLEPSAEEKPLEIDRGSVDAKCPNRTEPPKDGRPIWAFFESELTMNEYYVAAVEWNASRGWWQGVGYSTMPAHVRLIAWGRYDAGPDGTDQVDSPVDLVAA